MSDRTLENLISGISSRLEVLEFEASRLAILGKANQNAVISDSASLLYETVLSLREDIKDLSNIAARAGK